MRPSSVIVLLVGQSPIALSGLQAQPTCTASQRTKLLQDGLHQHQAGQLDEAYQLYQRVLQICQEDAHALHLSGMTLYGQGLAAELAGLATEATDLFAQASLSVRRAVGAMSPGGDKLAMQANLGEVLRVKGDIAEAEVVLRSILHSSQEPLLALHPGVRVQSSFNLAITLMARTRAILASSPGSDVSALWAEARQLLLLVRQEKPEHSQVHIELGVVASLQGNFSEALAAFEEALLVAPGSVFALQELSVSLHRLGMTEQARQGYLKVLQLDPDNAVAPVNLAALLQEEGDLGEALRLYREFLRRHPEDHVALNNYGAALSTAGQDDLAFQQLRKAVRLNPHAPDVWLNLAAHYQGEGLLEDAWQAYTLAYNLTRLAQPDNGLLIRRAIMLPHVVESESQAVNALTGLESAVDELLARDRLVLVPGIEYTHFPMVYLGPFAGANFRGLQEKIARLYLKADPGLTGVSPHLLTAHTTAIARNPGVTPPAEKPGQPSSPVRVGFVSKFFGEGEPHGLLLTGVIRHLPRTHFYVTVCPVMGAYRQLSPALAHAADSVLPLTMRTSSNIRILQEARFDVLVYADMNSEPVTHFLGFARLAPVQVLFWGNPVTSGNPSIDYFVSADVLESPHRTHMAPGDDPYTEQVVLLGGQGIWYDAPDLTGLDEAHHPAHRLALLEQTGLSEPAIIFMCAQSLFKLHPGYDAVVWAILQQSGPASHVVFLQGRRKRWTQLAQARLLRTIPPAHHHRVHFVARTGHGPAFLRLLAGADVILHPFPFGGSRTSAEALALGIPTVAMVTEQLRGRMAGAFYKTMGLGSWCCSCNSTDQYIATAVRLGNDAEFRAHVAQAIRERSHLLWGRREVVYEWARFLAGVTGITAPRPEDLGLVVAQDSALSPPAPLSPPPYVHDSENPQTLKQDVTAVRRPLEHNTLAREGHRLYAAGDMAGAVSAYMAALRINPEDAGLMSDLGAALQQMGRLGEAQHWLRRACDAWPTNPTFLVNLGVTEQALGNLQEAERLYLEALSREESQSESWALLNLANLMRDTNRVDEAVQLLAHHTGLAPLHMGGAVVAVLSLLELVPAIHRPALHALQQQMGLDFSLWDEVVRVQTFFAVAANSLVVWLSWGPPGSLPDLKELLERVCPSEPPPHRLLSEPHPQLRPAPGPDQGVHLVVQYYNPVDVQRQKQLEFCLRRNLANPYIERVHVLAEAATKDALDRLAGILLEHRHKLVVQPIAGRITFREGLQYANRRLPGKVVAIANADIFFDDTLARLQPLATLSMEGKLFALRRWESRLDAQAAQELSLSFVPRQDSQDAWLFRAPVDEQVVQAADFWMGAPRCDNRLARIFADAGYAVTSPSLHLVTHHVDKEPSERGSHDKAERSQSVVLDFSLGYPQEGQVNGDLLFVRVSDQWLF